MIDRDQLWAALWECFLLSGADPSGYTHETRTPEGRRAGLIDFVKRGEPERAVEAVRDLVADYDLACREAELPLGRRASPFPTSTTFTVGDRPPPGTSDPAAGTHHPAAGRSPVPRRRRY